MTCMCICAFSIIPRRGGIYIMEKKKYSKLCTAFCLTLGLTLAPAGSFQVQAAEVIATVEGTVMSGTTSELLKLSTKEGDMEIKLDSGTDASGCKVLLPDKKIFVSVSHGNDGYLHAVKITATSSTNTVTLDSSTSTVTGKITDKSKDDILYVDTAQGEMEIKLDPTTNLSGCSVLVENKTYQIACTRGSDAYMHAVSISDGTNSSSSQASASSWLTPAPASAVNASTSTVTGTVSDDTKENLLYLDTDGGQMQIVIDSNTDSRGGMVLTPDRKLTVTVYRGSDAYMHAATITGYRDSTDSVNVDTSSTSTVTGTVGSKSTENILYLDTPQGQMELKLDSVRSASGFKVLISGRKLSVTCARGSDAYMHAIDITGV